MIVGSGSCTFSFVLSLSDMVVIGSTPNGSSKNFGSGKDGFCCFGDSKVRSCKPFSVLRMVFL